MKRMLALVLAVGLLCSLCGCGDDGTGKGFRLPLGAEPTQLDPQVCTDTASLTVLAAVMEGLTQLDDNGNPTPAAADWTVSEDGCTYTFTLKESYWSTLSNRDEETAWDQPTRVVAEDFVFGLQRAQQAGTLPAALKRLTAAAVSDTVLTITLPAPNDSLLATLATAPCMPCNRAFFEYTAGRYGLERQYLLCNGAFWLAAWNHNESLLLYKNERYHEAAIIAPEAVRFVINPKDALAQLTNGGLDVAELTADQLPAARMAGVSIIDMADTVRSLWFSTAATAPTRNAAVRQALRDSIQWDTVYTHLKGAGEMAAVGWIPPSATCEGKPYRRPDNAHPFVTAVTEARTALKMGLTALYPEQTDPVLPTLTLVAAEDEVSANLARYIAQSWQKNLGISVNLSLLPTDRIGTAVPGGADAVIAVDVSTGVVASLQATRSELDAVEEQLREQCLSLPLSYPYRYYGIADGTQGIRIRPFGGEGYGTPFDFRLAIKKE